MKPFLYILPAYFAIAVFLIYPTIQTVINSFKDQSSTEWVGFENYTELLTNKGFQQTIYNTLLWMLIVPVVSVIIGLAVAVLADRLKPGSEKLVQDGHLPADGGQRHRCRRRVELHLRDPTRRPAADRSAQRRLDRPSAVDPVAWLEQSQLHFNSLLLMVVLLWGQIGFSMVLLSAAVKGVPVDTMEAARIDGANEKQIFFQVVVPQIKGTIITVYVTVIIGVMKIFDIVYVMTNGNFNTNVVGNEFWNQFSTFFNNGAASAIVVMLMIAVIPIMIYQVRHFKAEEANA